MDYILQLTASLAGRAKIYRWPVFDYHCLFAASGTAAHLPAGEQEPGPPGRSGRLCLADAGHALMLQLYFFCYGLTFIPYVGQYLVLGRFQAAYIAFVLNYAAYFCEIFRGGLLSVDKGQYEAAKVLGFSRWQTSMKIVVPQMLRVSLPPVCNECITLVKDTSLATAIGITEVLYFAKASVNRDVNATAFVVVAVFYLIMTYGLTAVFKRLEKKMTY